MLEQIEFRDKMTHFLKPNWAKFGIWVILVFGSLFFTSNEHITRFVWHEQRGFPIPFLVLSRSFFTTASFERVSFWGFCLDGIFWYAIACLLILGNNYKSGIIESVRAGMSLLSLPVKGSLLSLSNAFFGSFVFALLGSPTMLLIAIWDNNYQYSLFDYPFKDFVAIFFFLLVFSFALSLLPVLTGGCIFISILNRDKKNGNLSTKSAEKLGTVFGLLAGVGFSFMAYFLDYFVSQNSNGGYFDQVNYPLFVLSLFMTEAIIIGALVGRHTGNQLAARLTTH